MRIKVLREASIQIGREQKAAGKISKPHEEDNKKSSGEENRIKKRRYPMIPDVLRSEKSDVRPTTTSKNAQITVLV